MDLDPGEEHVAWPAIIAAAEEIRDRLDRSGLPSFVKTSGGKGLHVVALLKPKAEWAAVKDFAKSLAEAMAADAPERYVAVVTKSKRKGKILIDYLRNGRGATAASPCSTWAPAPGRRSRCRWPGTSLASCPGAAYFTVANTPTRLARQQSDPWADFSAAPQSSCRQRAGSGSGRKFIGEGHVVEARSPRPRRGGQSACAASGADLVCDLAPLFHCGRGGVPGEGGSAACQGRWTGSEISRWSRA